MKKIREIGVELVHEILEEGAYANLIVHHSLNGIPDGRDRGFLTDLVYGTVRRLMPIDHQISVFLAKPIKKKDRQLQTILRCAFYEILFTEAKPYAVVNEYVTIGKKIGNPGWGKMINGVLRNLLRQKDNLTWPKMRSETEMNAFFLSVPRWIPDLWIREKGEEVAGKIVKEIETERTPVLRVNTLKTDRDSFREKLRSFGIETEIGNISEDALRLKHGTDIRLIPDELCGSFTVQEESSQLVAKILDPSSNDTVLDMCAAPGGKTTHIAQQMKNKGKIFASDLYEHKTELIRQNAERLGIVNIITEQKDGTAWGNEMPEAFDRVLVDAPCSGLGVLNRRPDSCLHKQKEDVSALSEIQRSLLTSAYKALKPGGKLVYSTCTLTNKENMENVRWVLDTYPDMKLSAFDRLIPDLTKDERQQAQKGYLELLPCTHHTDGFFISAFIKDNRKS